MREDAEVVVVGEGWPRIVTHNASREALALCVIIAVTHNALALGVSVMQGIWLTLPKYRMPRWQLHVGLYALA